MKFGIWRVRFPVSVIHMSVSHIWGEDNECVILYLEKKTDTELMLVKYHYLRSTCVCIHYKKITVRQHYT